MKFEWWCCRSFGKKDCFYGRLCARDETQNTINFLKRKEKQKDKNSVILKTSSLTAFKHFFFRLSFVTYTLSYYVFVSKQQKRRRLSKPLLTLLNYYYKDVFHLLNDIPSLFTVYVLWFFLLSFHMSCENMFVCGCFWKMNFLLKYFEWLTRNFNKSKKVIIIVSCPVIQRRIKEDPLDCVCQLYFFINLLLKFWWKITY